MSWKDCKIKWQETPEGERIFELTKMEIFDIPELKEICDKFRRGYYNDVQFRAILINEIKQLELLNE